MSTPLPTTAVADFQLTSASRPAAEPPVCSCDEATTGADFKDLMADESLLAGVVTKLKQLLPEDEFAKITEMLESGNELPLAAIFSPESELLTGIHAAIPQAMQELARLDSQITTTLTSSAQRLPNGNTLVCEAAAKRVFEITHESEIVWEHVRTTPRSYRYTPDHCPQLAALGGAVGRSVVPPVDFHISPSDG